VVVLEKSPSVFLVAMFVRGFYLEVRIGEQGRTEARYVHGARCIARVLVGQA